MWYADGHIYMKQSVMWMKPMFVNTKYQAIITVKEIFPEKNRILYGQHCAVFDAETGETIGGEALLIEQETIRLVVPQLSNFPKGSYL